MPDALQVLREDHNKVKDMFQRFEKSESRSEKKQIAQQAIMELEVHAQIEEEIFYPSLKKQLGDVDLLHEAEEEHHVAEMLMEELKTMRLNDKSFDAKFMVLAENVKHHIGEEEGQLFPKAAEAGRDKLDRVGQQLMDRKMELMGEVESAPRKRRAASGTRAGSRNGGSRAGRTTRTTARSRTTTSRSGGTRGRASSGTRSASKSRSSSGTRSRAQSARSGTRSTATRSRAGGPSRARSSSRKRSTTKRSTTSRSRR